jgi:hypothetical protein
MKVDAADIADAGLVSEAELSATGASAYRNESVSGVSSGTITVVGGQLINYDDPIQAGDIAIISGNAAAGTYTVATATLDDFTVVEPIVDAGAGTVDFRHPAGSTRVGVDPSTLSFTTENTLQAALEDLSAGALPAAMQVGDHLVSKDGATFAVVHPIISGDDGWLSNCDADLLIEGLDP